MVYYKAKDTAFTRSADKIRAKTGNSAAIQWDEDEVVTYDDTGNDPNA